MSYSPTLSQRFASSWEAVGARVPCERAFERLCAAYAEPYRHYHTLRHIESCLGWLEWCWSMAEHPHEVALAIWYHDVVYDPLRADNEAMSARFARAELTTAAVTEPVIRRIEALIEATRAHRAESGDAALLVDIDLAILGAPEHEFESFERAVRDEYRAFDDAAYARGRARVLSALLAREPLYATPLLASELAASARRNLKRALAKLSGDCGSLPRL